jgi:hypothetical protein
MSVADQTLSEDHAVNSRISGENIQALMFPFRRDSCDLWVCSYFRQKAFNVFKYIWTVIKCSKVCVLVG